MEEKIFELMTRMYVEIQDMKSSMTTKEDITEVKHDIVGLKEDMSVLKEDVAGLTEKVGILQEDMVVVRGDIVTLKQNVSRLEDRMMDKVEALFDARDIQMERDAEVVMNLKQVQDKVSELELRMMRDDLRES